MGKAKSILGCVSTGHQEVTGVGELILQKGGNAFDAAIACGFASTICEPMLSSLGGGGYLLSKVANEDYNFYDFFVSFPGKNKALKEPQFSYINVDFTSETNQSFHVGRGSVAVPGILKGLVHCHKELGVLSLAEVIEPTIKLSENGVTMNDIQSYVIDILNPTFPDGSYAQEIYRNNNEPLKSGEILKNPKYTEFLRAIVSEGVDDFYKGSIAKMICDDLEGYGNLNLEDLATYEVIKRKPLVFSYKGVEIITNPLPSLGGEMIKMFFEEFSRRSNFLTKEDELLYIVETLIAIEERLVVTDKPKEVVFQKGTTHISVSDNKGNLASMSLTNGEGSGYCAPGTGVMLNNMLGEDDLCDEDYNKWPIGERLPSMMAPIIIQSESKPKIVLGSGGSKRIRSSLAQVLLNIIDFDMDLKQSIEAPRMNWNGKSLQLEPGINKELLHKLKERNINYSVWSKKEFYFGGVHSVIENKDSFGDFRRGGVGKVVLTSG